MDTAIDTHDLKVILCLLFPSLGRDELKLLRAILNSPSPLNRRQLMKRTKIERNRVYKLASQLEQSDCIRAVSSGPSIRGESKLYDLTFKGAVILVAHDSGAGLSNPLEKIRKLLGLPILRFYGGKEAEEFSPDVIAAMLKLWAQCWVKRPNASRILDEMHNLEFYVVPQSWTCLMAIALDSKNNGIRLTEALEKLGITRRDIRNLLPIVSRQLSLDRQSHELIESQLLSHSENKI